MDASSYSDFGHITHWHSVRQAPSQEHTESGQLDLVIWFTRMGRPLRAGFILFHNHRIFVDAYDENTDVLRWGAQPFHP